MVEPIDGPVGAHDGGPQSARSDVDDENGATHEESLSRQR
jgi:hypothetical protein